MVYSFFLPSEVPLTFHFTEDASPLTHPPFFPNHTALVASLPPSTPRPRILLLANHGVLAAGPNLFEAFRLVCALELCCKAFLLAMSMINQSPPQFPLPDILNDLLPPLSSLPSLLPSISSSSSSAVPPVSVSVPLLLPNCAYLSFERKLNALASSISVTLLSQPFDALPASIQADPDKAKRAQEALRTAANQVENFTQRSGTQGLMTVACGSVSLRVTATTTWPRTLFWITPVYLDPTLMRVGKEEEDQQKQRGISSGSAGKQSLLL